MSMIDISKDAEINYRFYEDGDEESILELVKSSFGFEMNMDYWLWRYKENPRGKGIISLAFHDKILVAHYGVCLIKCYYRGEVVTAGFAMTAMTHPDYQGKGIFVKVAENVFRKAKTEGLPIIYGFPNPLTVNAYRNRLNWFVKNPFTVWIHKSSFQRILKGMSFEKINDIENLDIQYFEQMKDKYLFAVVRDKIYFKWRYFDSPDNLFQVYKLEIDNELVGVVVLKIYEFSDGRKRGHIIDWLVEDSSSLSLVLKYSLDHFMGLGINHVTLWANANQNEDSCFELNGFVMENMSRENWGYVMSFGYLDLNDHLRVMTDSSSIEKFFLTMGDCNIF